MAERRPYHPPIPEPQRTLHEGGNGSPGLPPTLHERANPPPESRAYPALPQKSALNRAIEQTRKLYEQNSWTFLPLPEAPKVSLYLPLNPQNHSKRPAKDEIVSNPPPLFIDENQKKGMISDEERATPHKKEGTMPRITSPVPKDRQAPENTTLYDERERQEIEESIRNLKQLRTMRQRISTAQDLTQDQLNKLRQHDPAFTEAIITGLNKRPYRIMKAGRLLYRMTEGDLSPARKPNYGLLMDKVVRWFEAYPAEHKDYLKKTSRRDRRREGEAEIELSLSTRGIGEEGKSELAGVQNALVCAHDLIRIYQEVGVEPPKPLRQLYRRLEKRRAYLDPNHANGSDH